MVVAVELLNNFCHPYVVFSTFVTIVDNGLKEAGVFLFRKKRIIFLEFLEERGSNFMIQIVKLAFWRGTLKREMLSFFVEVWCQMLGIRGCDAALWFGAAPKKKISLDIFALLPYVSTTNEMVLISQKQILLIFERL